VIETANLQIDEEQARAQKLKVSPGRYVTLTVTDTGTGMDEETRARLFEPFFTTKERGKGTGLGLATVYAIVKQNAGEIRVHTQLGRGSSFEVYFPSVEPRKEAPQLAAAMAPPGGGRETLLLVEDEGALR